MAQHGGPLNPISLLRGVWRVVALGLMQWPAQIQAWRNSTARRGANIMVESLAQRRPRHRVAAQTPVGGALA